MPFRTVFALTVVMAFTAAGGVGSAPGAVAPASPSVADLSVDRPAWSSPVEPLTVVREFEAPPHRYGAGHRGVDLAIDHGGPVTAPAGGVVAFRGAVAGRALITIDHGGGYVSTLEPVESSLRPGDVVAPGDRVGVVADGGHADGGLHFGVRLHGEYINPLTILGLAPRPILLPCCD